MIKKLFSEKIYSSISLVIIFHIVGIIGFANEPLVDLFMHLVPIHLLLMLALVLWNHQSWNKNFFIFSTIVYVTSFVIEMLGTNTGLIFGEYAYGKTLGFKLWNTPLLIGVNWFILVYSMGCLLSRYRIHNSLLFAGIGATALVMLDMLIEPIAMRFDYWQWAGNKIPLQNYVAWWLVAFIFMLIFNRLHFNKQNIVAVSLLIIQFLFFILLNLL